MRALLAAWLAARTARERRLAGATAAVLGLAAVVIVAGATWSDLARREARVAAATRTLARVRRLAATAPAADAGDDRSLLARVEETSRDAIGGERIAAMTPSSADAPDGLRDERVAMRVAGASLDEAVRLLHALAASDPPLPADHLVLQKHPDDPRRFDLTLEVHRRVRAVPPS